MRIFRYLFREVSSSFAAVSFIILLIFLSSRFIKYLARAANGSMSSDVLLWIMLYRLPGFVEMILPIGFFVGVLLACGRLYVDSEMIVLQACGMSKTQLLKKVLGPALLVMMIVASLTCWLTPIGEKKYHQLLSNPENFSGISTLVEGGFKTLGSDTVLYTGSLSRDKTQLQDVFVFRYLGGEDNKVSIIRADSARLLNLSAQQRWVELADGVEYTGNPSALDFSIAKYSRYQQTVDVAEQKEVEINEIGALSTKQLLDAKSNKELAALHWRLSFPLLVPIVAIMGFALSETSHRRGRYAKMLPGVILYMVYFGLLFATRSEVEKGRVAAVGMWGVHVVFFAIALMIMYLADIRRFWQAKR